MITRLTRRHWTQAMYSSSSIKSADKTIRNWQKYSNSLLH